MSGGDGEMPVAELEEKVEFMKEGDEKKQTGVELREIDTEENRS